MAKIEKMLNVDLYRNQLTERSGDHIARLRLTGTMYNSHIADEIVRERTEYRKETIVNIMDLADQKKAEALTRGMSVNDGLGQFLPTVRGSFEGENATYDDTEHALSVAFIMSKKVRDMLKKVKVVTNGLATTGPVINQVIDSTMGKKSERLTQRGPIVVKGSNIKVMGDDPRNGLFFIPADGEGAPVRVSLLIHNDPSEITCMLPGGLQDGKEYRLKVTTQFSSGNRLIKDPRSYEYPANLYVEMEGSI